MTARVLIVDDLAPNVKLLEAKLANEYYDYDSAMSGKEALVKVKQFKPDIILLDVMMPEMDGFETCKRLKADPETSYIPVVMVTALSDITDRVTGLQSGADDFITKPINDVHLFARVKSLVRIKMMLDELRLRDKTGSQFGLLEQANAGIENLSGAKILVVDDDVVESKHIQETLAKIQMQVTVVKPEQMNDVAASSEFDLFIVSTQLDNADGIRLCMHLRSQEKSRQTPQLILVDEDDRALLFKGLEMGINDYIVTPLDANELLARVKTQVRRKRYQDALRSNYEQSLSLAIMDSLTKLYNRRYLDAHLQNMVVESKAKNLPLSLISIDIDHF
ncbi:MAG: response regulator, partial [Proteobacteria bacterium]|nr:response regulator [Pseudomonadota bacterium]